MRFGKIGRLDQSGRNIVTFGFASLLTDVSSEMIAPILPLFLSGVLGLDKVFIGLVEGIAESTASLAKLVSGWLSDRLPKRKPLVILGYGLSSLAKPLLALARTGPQVIAVRFTDRLGKGIRTSPRDALLAESVTPGRRGLAFGFHRSMDSAGAILGPGLAALLLAAGAGYRTIFLWAFLPAALAVAALFIVREPAGRTAASLTADRERAGRQPLGPVFYLFLAAAGLFTLGNSSDAFITLRAQSLGLPVAAVPLIWMLLNVFNTATATPAGWLSDRLGRKRIILAGLVVYAAVYAGLALATKAWQIWPLMIGYGLYYGLAEGGFRALVADLVPRESLGFAFGLYHAVVGVCLLPASLLTGFLWERRGPSTAFLAGSGLAAAAALLLLTVRIPDRESAPR
jgi:MFS family permease